MTRSRTAGIIAAGVITAAIGLSLAGQGVALAATDTVTNCSGDPTVPGSLPAVVAAAHSGDTITFNPSPSCDLITLTSTLDITQNLTITGPGAANMAVSGGGTVGVFSISSGAVVGISGLTIENGSSTTISGGITNDGGTVTLSDSTVSGNFSIDTEAGAILNTGSMTITNSTISGNTNGSIYNSGGGSSLTITGSTISGNTGGAVRNNGGSSVTLTDSTISGNNAGHLGGAIYNPGGTVTLTDSTVSGNSASVGGGIVTLSGGTSTLTDSTISGNTATGGAGGIYTSGATVNAGATIVAGNTGGSGNCSGPMTSAGYNLTDDTTGAPCGFTQPTDLVNTNPQLGPLQSSGGTPTMVPQPGSPAIGQIPPVTSLNGVQVCPRYDQNGQASAPGGNCTIGAVEIPTPPASQPQVISYTSAPPSNAVVGGPAYVVQATGGGSGNPVTFSVDPTTTNNACSLGTDGATVSFTHVGICVIDANQAGNSNYSAADQVQQSFPVGQGTPVITWATPAAIPWGTPLSAAQLDATASVPGTFTYTPPSGTLLGPGNGQSLSASFAPTDSADYTTASASVTVNVVFNPAGCITGKVTGPLVIGAGQAYCVGPGASITNGVTIKPGGAMDMTGGVIKGGLTAAGATAITVCGASVTGGVSITGATGALDIGGCGANTISGSVSITNNTGGLTYTGNTVSGSLTITGNTGVVQILPPNPTTGKVTIQPNSP